MHARRRDHLVHEPADLRRACRRRTHILGGRRRPRRQRGRDPGHVQLDRRTRHRWGWAARRLGDQRRLVQPDGELDLRVGDRGLPVHQPASHGCAPGHAEHLRAARLDGGQLPQPSAELRGYQESGRCLCGRRPPRPTARGHGPRQPARLHELPNELHDLGRAQQGARPHPLQPARVGRRQPVQLDAPDRGHNDGEVLPGDQGGHERVHRLRA